jgi:hypothetical protein
VFGAAFGPGFIPFLDPDKELFIDRRKMLLQLHGQCFFMFGK